MIPGFRITDSSVANMVADIEEKVNDLSPSKLIIIIQLLYNSVFQCKTVNGDRILPKKGADRKYHAEGELVVVNKDTLRELFETLQTVFRASRGFQCTVLSPLPRYLWATCCSNAAHITNSENSDYAAIMGRVV
jgi:hypothetical protein